MAVTGKEEVDGVGLQFVVLLRVVAQKNLVAGEFAEAGQKLCIYLPGNLLRGYPSEQDVLDLHAAVIQQRNFRSASGTRKSNPLHPVTMVQ